MIRNYLKALIRNMRKNKLHTAINVVGLSVAFTCSIILLLNVYNEFSFDNFHANKNSLYKLYHFSNSPEGLDIGSSMSYPMASTLKTEGIGVIKATRFKNSGREVRYNNKTLEQSINLVDNDFFSMFSFPVIKGARQNPLADVGSVVLGEKTATSLFGNEDPIGKTMEVKLGGKWNSFIVSAVVQEAPINSSVRFGVLLRTEMDPSYPELKDRWTSEHHPVYVQLSDKVTQAQVENQLKLFTKKYNPPDTNYLKGQGYKTDAQGEIYGTRLLPMKDVHFDANLGGGNAVSKSFLYILLLVACVIVLIASFNFINLNIGISFTRTKEMGIRKCLGAGKRQIWLQVWGESMLIVLMSMVIALGASAFLIRALNKASLAKFDGSLLYSPLMVAVLLLLLFFVSFIASGYPSFIMSKLKTVEILKGTISLKKPGFFRNALIVAQFVIAIVLISATIIIYQQFQHLRNAPLGYATSSVISIPIHNDTKGREFVTQMRNRLSSQTTITSVSGASINLGLGQDGSESKSSYGFDFNGRSVQTNFLVADFDILKTLGIQLKEGRDFSTANVSDTMNAVIVTESMAKELTDKNDAVGLCFYSDSSRPKWCVIGVIPDIHLYSMREKNEPLTISMGKDAPISYLFVGVNTRNPMATMELVKKTYSQIEPGTEFKGSYINENIDRWYANEQRLSKMFSIASMVAIILSCMGLFGIAFIVIRQRVKEIGVRKVLGASVQGIASLVTKEFIKPVLVATIIAIPIAWWSMHLWLQDFLYRINIQWWIFLLAGVLALMIALITVCFQAIKAAVANPVKSLRTE